MDLCYRVGFEEHNPFDPILFFLFSRKTLKRKFCLPHQAKRRVKRRQRAKFEEGRRTTRSHRKWIRS
jgi:hypothetical protein